MYIIVGILSILLVGSIIYNVNEEYKNLTLEINKVSIIADNIYSPAGFEESMHQVKWVTPDGHFYKKRFTDEEYEKFMEWLK